MDRRTCVNEYYMLVDGGNFSRMYGLFSNDIVYERGRHVRLSGKGAFEHFYEHDTLIASGKHAELAVYESGDIMTVKGRFVGTLKTGEAVTINFVDAFTFNNEHLITHRKTTFPAGRDI